MSIVTEIWSQLVARRLWPVALLLLGALAAVPLLLANDPQPQPVPALPNAAAGQPAVAEADPIVALATAEDARRRRVLGARKDPFEPAPIKVRAAATPEATGADTSTPAPAPVSPGTGGASAGGGIAPPSFTAPTAPVAVPEPEKKPKPEYPLHTLTVRFGASDGALERGKLRRLEALPSPDAPVLVYLGVQDGGKVAVFMVDTGVVPQGDGSCKPDPSSCETLHLREGDTEFFDVVDDEGGVTGQYQLDLIDIKRKTTASKAKAKSAYARESKAGRKLLRARQASLGPLRFRYDAKRGVVKRRREAQALIGVASSAVASAGGFDVAP